MTAQHYGFYSSDDVASGRKSDPFFEQDSAELGDRTATWFELTNQNEDDE